MDAKDILRLQEAYLEVHQEQELDEATAMAKRGLNEPAIRNQIAKSTGGGQAADRATALENRPTYGQRGVNTQARQNLARAQRGDFRRTTSSDYGLRGYAHKSDDPAVKAKQAARGAQRGVLTPNEKKKFNREQTDLYDVILSHLLDEGYAETQQAAEAIMVNMSEDWRDSIVEARTAVASPAPGDSGEIRKRMMAKSDKLAQSPNKKDQHRAAKIYIAANFPKKREKKQLNIEDFKLWINDLLNEGYDLSEYTWDDMYEIYMTEAIEGLRPASERMKGALTSSQRASQQARARREQKKQEELEKAANAVLNQMSGVSRRSSAPMGSTPAPQKAEAPQANRTIKPKVKRDDLASAANEVLRSLR